MDTSIGDAIESELYEQLNLPVKMKLSVIVSVVAFSVLCTAFEFRPFPFGRSNHKSNSKILMKWKPVEQYRQLPSVYFTKRHFQPVNVRNDKINLPEYSSQLTSDFDVYPVTKRLNSIPKLEPSAIDTSIYPTFLKYDPNSFHYNDFFPVPNQRNTVSQAESSIVEVYALPPDPIDSGSSDNETLTESNEESESKLSLFTLSKHKPSDQAPDLEPSIQTAYGDYDDLLQDSYPSNSPAISLTQMLGKVFFGLPLFLGYLRVVTYLNQLCSVSTTCSNVTVTSTVTETANSVATVTASSTLTAFYTFTQTFLFSQTTTFLTITITRSTLTMTTTSYTTSVVLSATNPSGRPLGNEINEETEALTFFKPVIEATLVPYVYTTYEVVPITSQVIVSTMQPLIDTASLPDRIVIQSEIDLAPTRLNNKFADMVDPRLKERLKTATENREKNNLEIPTHNAGLSDLVQKLANYYKMGVKSTQ